MRVWDRLFLFIYSLLVLICSVATLLAAFGIQMVQSVTETDVIAAAVLLLLFSILTWIRIFWSRGSADHHQPVILSRSDQGEIRITIDTIESLVTRAGRSIRGISELQPRIRVTENGIRIAVRIIVEPDTEIPSISQALQDQVKTYVSKLSGILVEEVIVSVKDIRKPQVSRSRDLA